MHNCLSNKYSSVREKPNFGPEFDDFEIADRLPYYDKSYPSKREV